MKGHMSSSMENRYEVRGERMERKEQGVEKVIEWEGEEGARLYLISAEVLIEQKVQQAASVVKPWVLL